MALDELEMPFKKIEIRHSGDSVNLSEPGNEFLLRVFAGERPLVPWRDFYVNSGSNWYGVFLVGRLDARDRLRVCGNFDFSSDVLVEAVDLRLL